jgi:hypothetical protein
MQLTDTAAEAQIDALVAALYGLTPTEAAVVGGAAPAVPLAESLL